jgi:hypothetical protein
MPAQRRAHWTDWILRYAREFELDPFLLAELGTLAADCVAQAVRRAVFGAG